MRALTKEEIEVRLASTQNNKASLLLYKTARTDSAFLDETFGPFNWSCSFSENKGNLFCTISVKNPDTGEWVSKSDCGSESNIEKEKGEASDAFKRAGFKWGIGIELYSAPKINIPLKDSDMYNGRCCMTFSVKDIEISEGHKIKSLTIQDRWGNIRYTYPSSTSEDYTPVTHSVSTNTGKKTKYTNAEFKERMGELKAEYDLNNPVVKKKMENFYNFWTSPSDNNPDKSKVEMMRYFDLDQRLKDWVEK